MTRTFLRHIVVRARPRHHECENQRLGWVVAGPMRFACALGRSGIGSGKREGDGMTPRGHFSLIQAFWRQGQGVRPRTGLQIHPIRRQDGWCDAPEDRNYNCRVTRPYPASHEKMWRKDELYDLVIDIGWNRGPIAKGRGSAIFVHLARATFTPTAGCVALKRADLRRLLARIGPSTRLVVV